MLRHRPNDGFAVAADFRIIVCFQRRISVMALDCCGSSVPPCDGAVTTAFASHNLATLLRSVVFVS
jgi:hypothetical protein